MNAPASPVKVGSHGRAEVPLETKSRQRMASDPSRSAWVSANAGSGKTWVLSRRVIRLLLAGTPASKILCLTYTKAAAATMSNRVFAELARWTMLDDAALRREIRDIEDREPTSSELRKARRLFAEAIETPGGLKIQTIHAFSEAILHQFPLEADLPGRFEILDDAGKADLLRASKLRTLLAATSEPRHRRRGLRGDHRPLRRIWLRAGDQRDARCPRHLPALASECRDVRRCARRTARRTGD